MRTRILILVFVSAGLLLAACGESEFSRIQLVLKGKHTLNPPQSIPGELILLDGIVTINEGARIEGDAYMLGGSLELLGEIQGDIILLNGVLELQDTALVGGEIRLAGGTYNADPEARIAGQVVEGIKLPTDLVESQESAGSGIVRWIIQTTLIVAGASLLGRWKPDLFERSARAMKKGLIVCLAVGALAGVVWLVLVVQMAFTIVLIPLSILATVLLFLLIVYGWMVIGSLLGEQIEEHLPWQFSRVQSIALGTLVFLLLLELLRFIPLLGDGLAILISLFAFGALLLTRLGLVEFNLQTDKQLL